MEVDGGDYEPGSGWRRSWGLGWFWTEQLGSEGATSRSQILILYFNVKTMTVYSPFCKEILDLLQGSTIHSSLSDIQKCKSKQFVPFCPKIAYLSVHEGPEHKNEEPLKKKMRRTLYPRISTFNKRKYINSWDFKSSLGPSAPLWFSAASGPNAFWSFEPELERVTSSRSSVNGRPTENIQSG